MNSFEQERIIDWLFSNIFSFHSFNYKTLAEAKKTLTTGTYQYCFDALSLRMYHSNLDSQLLRKLRNRICDYYDLHYDRESKKELFERSSLFYFLTSPCCAFYDYTIEKNDRPDFILSKNGQRVGVEVVELTTQHDQILHRISKDYFGKGKSLAEIKSAAAQKHGLKTKHYVFGEINDRVYVGTHIFSSTEKQKLFACQFQSKYMKYESMISSFDTFIVLGDSQRSGEITISCKEDVENIFDWLRADTNISGASFVIMWRGNTDSRLIISQYDS